MKEYTVECSNKQDYTKPLKNELRIVKIIAQDIFEATEKAQDRFRKYECFKILKSKEVWGRRWIKN